MVIFIAHRRSYTGRPEAQSHDGTLNLPPYESTDNVMSEETSEYVEQLENERCGMTLIGQESRRF